MCVIIARDPGITIPDFKLQSACEVNGDGHGISIIDRGKIVTIKQLKNNPKDVQKVMEDAKDQQVFVHLRFRTRGNVDVDNCHPFPVFDGDGYQLNFMHNGTVSDMNDIKDTYSDSYRLNEKVLRPLVERYIKTGGDPDKLYDDPLFLTVVSKFAGLSNVFTFYDNSGASLIFNKDSGKQFDGWWASNEYSFNRYHRSGGAGYDHSFRSNYYSGLNDDDVSDIGVPKGGKEKEAKGKGKPKEVAKAGLPAPQLKDKIDSNNIKTTETIKAPLKRETFCEVAGLTDLAMVTALEHSDIEELVLTYPDHAVMLIQDLLLELYIKTSAEAGK